MLFPPEHTHTQQATSSVSRVAATFVTLLKLIKVTRGVLTRLTQSITHWQEVLNQIYLTVIDF